MRYFYFIFYFKKATEEHSRVAHRLWERINTLCSHLNTFSSRYLEQDMLKNALFFGKILKNYRSVGNSAPKLPLASSMAGGSALRPQSCYPHYLDLKLLSPLLIAVVFLSTFAALTCDVLSKKNKGNNSKCSAFCACFTSTSAVFVDGDAKIFFVHGRRYTYSYATVVLFRKIQVRMELKLYCFLLLFFNVKTIPRKK